MEEMLEVEQSIAASLEHLEFVIQAFNKAAIVSADEIVADFLPPAAQGVDELIKAVQPTFGNAFDPGPDSGLGSGLRSVLVKNGGQLLLQGIGLLQLGRVTEKPSQGASFIDVQGGGFLAQGPQVAIQLLVVSVGELFFQSSQFLLTQVIQAISVSPGDMETINHYPHMPQHFSHRFGKALIHITACRMDVPLQAGWDRAQEFDHGILLTVWQNGQDDQPSIQQAGRSSNVS